MKIRQLINCLNLLDCRVEIGKLAGVFHDFDNEQSGTESVITFVVKKRERTTHCDNNSEI